MTSVHVNWYGDAYKLRARAAAIDGMREFMEGVGSRAVDLAPVDTGTLRRSMTVTPHPAAAAVSTSFNTPYALYQHEGLGFRHPRGGQAKYLEQPFFQLLPKAHDFVMSRVRRVM